MDELRSFWEKAWAANGVKCADPALFARLIGAYSEPHRKYHTRQHLAECLRTLDQVWFLAERPGEVALALWFHDAIYELRAADNEEKSATFVVIDEVDTDNWGIAGEQITVRRKRGA
jgi:predicted metal-dependent HD superfamily phosphohydrolase